MTIAPAPVVKVKGVKVELGGTIYIVPPLALGPLEQLRERILQFGASNADPMHDSGMIATAIDVAYHALRRNYPDMTRDQVADLLDLSNMLEVFTACMDAAGLKRKAQEEAERREAAEGNDSGEAPGRG